MSNSTAAAEAVARAKAIAARLSGTVAPTQAPAATAAAAAAAAEGNDSENAGGKRKRWGVMPTPAGNGNGNAVSNGTSTELPGLSEAAKKQKLATEPTEKRLWVMSTSSEKPISHFVAYLSPKLDDIVIAINKEMDEKQNQQGPRTFDKNNKDKVSAPPKFAIELRGRGSSRPPPLPGMPELPLHIMLLGLPEAIARAEPIVEPLLYDAENAPLEQLSPEQEQQQLLLQQQRQQQGSYEGGALTLTGSNSNNNNNNNNRNMANYRPTSVAQLIGQANMSPEDAMLVVQGGGQGGLEEEVLVPNGIVGFIIGRGGENISSMQARTGCKVQIQKEHELQPGQAQRVITLQAMRQEQIDECRALIENMVQERVQASGRGGPGGGGSAAGGGGPKDGRVQDALAGGHALVQVDIPDADVGLIIGKMGSTIKSIQEQSGASIQVPQSGNVDNPSMRTVSITHPTEQGAMYAKQMIEDLLKSKPSYAGGGGGGGGQGGGQQFSIQVPIPDKDVGLCIGRQGCVIRHMQSTTNTRIQIPSQAPHGEMYRISTVSGSQQGCEQAKQMIERIVAEQSSTGVMGGGQGQGGQQQQYYSSQGGQQQQGQSAEWAAYYAAQAAAQQQQQYAASTPQAAPAPAAATQAATGADAYYEQFFRYGYYYGEEAARAYYGAWSPPVGTANPYGVNPAGIQAAPAPAPASAPVPAPAPAAQPPRASSVDQGPSAADSSRETSRRKVSNLPSWMTKGQN